MRDGARFHTKLLGCLTVCDPLQQEQAPRSSGGERTSERLLDLNCRERDLHERTKTAVVFSTVTLDPPSRPSRGRSAADVPVFEILPRSPVPLLFIGPSRREVETPRI